jgi:hypothetical protein
LNKPNSIASSGWILFLEKERSFSVLMLDSDFQYIRFLGFHNKARQGQSPERNV